MRPCRQMGVSVLVCLLWLAAPALLQMDLAYVSDHSLYLCTCEHGLSPCGVLNSSQCNCRDPPLSALQRPQGQGLLHTSHLTVWYTSPLNAALLLNHSQVRYLSLVRCGSLGGRPTTSYDYFTVRRLERLTVSYPGCGGAHSHDVALGAGRGAAYEEEVQVSIIHTSILMGTPSLKAYTVLTRTDGNGVLPFPHIHMCQAGLPQAALISVTFLY